MITSLLIANRGEIACRIIRTARRLGIRTVAVYSDADAKALHVRQADAAVHIGASPARESYLVGEKIIAAARASGAEAIHPGYGFLSENAAFAQAVIDAGLIWVGPRPASITAMGLKDEAKQRMAAAGVPVTPGYMGENQDPAWLGSQAAAIGFPVLIKAVAGGGGKGMRRVDSGADFADALTSCQREARASFGNAHVLIEKYIERPRHIEVQVFGDTHGQIAHLFERDCSLQRRHQKVIEEAPAPGMDAETRAQLCAAAVKAAQAVDYVGAGTIEFIADASEGLRADRIWFMEMNTRLQVEHPVTEAITGVDLVEWQLRIASGEPLPKRQEELGINGHAVEARLYAEDPARGFLPSIGRVDDFAYDTSMARVETGVAPGDAISPFYDPMIAKLITHGDNRNAAIAALRATLTTGAVGPLVTNAGFLFGLLGNSDFAKGDVDTGLIERDLETLCARSVPDESALVSAAAKLIGAQGAAPWAMQSGFRLNAPARRMVRLTNQFGDRFAVTLSEPVSGENPAQPCVLVNCLGALHYLRLARGEARGGGAASDGSLLSPMPGRVIAVEVAAGDRVTKGQRLVTLEAMKMEHSLIAPFDGIVAELPVASGGQVSENTLLVRIEPDA